MAAPSGSRLLALQRLAGAIAGTDVAWTITGSFGLYLQGMPHEPRDIDVETDEAGAAFLARHFAAELLEPLRFGTQGSLRSHFAVLSLGATPVDIVGDLEVLVGDEWLRSGHHARPTWIDCEGLRLPVLDAREEHAWTARIGRSRRAEMIAQWLRERSPRS